MYARMATTFGLVIMLAIGGQAHEGRNVYDGMVMARQDPAYQQQVCLPNITNPVVPPCQEIDNIGNACTPNGTLPLDLIAHAECMCGGSFFQDAIGCLGCRFIHGFLSPAESSANSVIYSSASSELCTGTPTAAFPAIFASLSFNPVETGSVTEMSDFFPSQSAVSLYFTASGVQGPGPITGSATAATRIVTTESASESGPSSGGSTATSAIETSGTSGGSVTAGSGSGSTSTSSSSGGTAPTGVWIGGLGLAAGLAGLAVL